MVLTVEDSDGNNTAAAASITGNFGMTASSGDVIFVAVEILSLTETVSSITGTNCSFQSSARAIFTQTASQMEFWWGTTTSALSAVKIVVNLSGTGVAATFICIAINGANTSSPFDANVGLPYSTTGSLYNSNNVTYSTNNANDIILVVLGATAGFGSSAALASGFTGFLNSKSAGRTGFSSGTNSINGQYKVVSSTQASVSTNFPMNPNSGNYTIAADAVVQAGGAAAAPVRGSSGTLSLLNVGALDLARSVGGKWR